MALYYSEQVCELREVVLKNKPPEMLSVSEKGTVPVMILNNGNEQADRVIDESLDVMSWALTQNDPDGWLDDISHVDNTEIHPLIERNDKDFTQCVTRYKYADRYPEKSQLAHFEECRGILQELEGHMVQDESESYFIQTPKLSFLDVAIFPFVRQCLAVDINLTRALALPKVTAWHDYLIASELFGNIMTKYSPWDKQNTEVVEFGPSR